MVPEPLSHSRASKMGFYHEPSTAARVLLDKAYTEAVVIDLVDDLLYNLALFFPILSFGVLLYVSYHHCKPSKGRQVDMQRKKAIQGMVSKQAKSTRVIDEDTIWYSRFRSF